MNPGKNSSHGGLGKLMEAMMVILCFSMPMLVTVPWFKLLQMSNFSQYYVISRLMQMGCSSQIYSLGTVSTMQQALVPNSMHSSLPFLIPPFLVWLFYPLAYLNFNLALYLFTFLLAVALLISSLLLCWLLNIRGTKLYWAMILIGAFGPCVMSIWLGQLAPLLLLGLTGLFIGLKKKRWLIAGLAQSIFLLKPQLALPLLLFELGAGLTDIVVLTAAVAVLGLVISFALGGKELIFAYSNLAMANFANPYLYTNASTLYEQLYKLALERQTVLYISLALYSVLLILSYFVGRQTKSQTMRLGLLFFILVPLSLCLSLQTYSYDLLLLIPGIVFLLTYSLSGFALWLRSILFIGIIAIFILPAYLCWHYLYILKGGILDPFFLITFIFAIGASIIVRSLSNKHDEKENFSASTDY